MLHEFSVENFRSIKERKTLCLQAQEIGEDIEGNVACELGYNILKSLSVYGANSSGKSNLLVAVSAMRIMVKSSAKLNEGEELFYRPFLLSETDNEPTLFEIVFTQSGYCYRYGFTYTRYKIEEEWLYRSSTPSSQEEMLFLRSLKEVETDNKLFAEGRDNEKILNDNRLFLSLCAQLRGEISNSLMLWFSYSLNVISGLKSSNLPFYSRNWFAKDNDNRDKALEFFKKLQLGFENLAVRQKQIKSSFTDEKVVNALFSIHNKYNSKGEICGSIERYFEDMESEGSKNLFNLTGPIFSTLHSGSVLVVDELDAKMHPLISQYIIRLFNNSESNPNNAQLIFSTHDTHLLSSKLLRRDQIWFTEKDNKEQTDLYCLTDIVLSDGSVPRNDTNYEKNYIAGRYGAIPYIINE